MGLKFTPTPKRNNIGLKSNIQNYTLRLQLAEFFQNKGTHISQENLFSKTIYYYPKDRDLDHQIDILNNLNLEKKQGQNQKAIFLTWNKKELSKLRNNETIVIKPADKGGAL